MRRLTFVVTAGRSGSTALSKILHMHPEVLTLNELYSSIGMTPFPSGILTAGSFWRLLADPGGPRNALIRCGAATREMLYPQNPGRFDAHKGGIPTICMMVLPALPPPGDELFDELEAQVQHWPSRSASEHYLVLFDWLAARFNRQVVVERSGFSLHSIPMLREAFPHARFVHLYRDGPDAALSMSRHNVFRVIALMQEIGEHVGASHRELLKQLPCLSPDDPRIPDDLRPVLRMEFSRELVVDRPIPLASFGALWSEAIDEGMRHLAAIPEDQRIAMRYEDLLDDPEGELARLADVVGVEPEARWLRHAREMLDPRRRGSASRLAADDREALAVSCAPGMRALGMRG